MASVDERYDIAIREILERFPTDRPDLEQHHRVAPHVTRHTVLLVVESLGAEEGRIAFPNTNKNATYIVASCFSYCKRQKLCRGLGTRLHTSYVVKELRAY